MNLLLLLGAGYGAYKLKQKFDADRAAKAAAAQATASAATPAAPIMDTSNTITSIQRTVQDPGMDTDDPDLRDQNYGVVTGWGPNWGSYGRQNIGTYRGGLGGYSRRRPRRGGNY